MKVSARLIPLLVAFMPLLVRAGEFPVVDGVLGGVPHRSAALKNAATLATVPGTTKPATNVTAGKLRYIENSGVCETTPNVYQASGYGDLTKTDSLWFWFFGARHNADNAPLALWFNGGPGSSSMIGLFQEHGPCRITNDSSSVVINPYSWNNESNVLYIDQPVGVGFSHGNISRTGTSQKAAADIWSFMQIFLSDPKFKQYQTRELSIWTESYGGHYGPVFAKHFLDQNAAIANGTISGIPLNLKGLAIGDGVTDALTQYAGYAEYSAINPYRPLAPSNIINEVNGNWSMPGGCKDQITQCYETGGSNFTVCSDAQDFCNGNIVGAFFGEDVDFNFDFVPMPSNDTYPPDFSKYLNVIGPSIGADINYTQSNPDVYSAFADTGEWMSNSALLALEAVINAGVKTLIYVGDADFIVTYNGLEAMMDALNTTFTAEYKKQEFKNYTVAGENAGLYKTAGNLTYIRVFGAGHEVPAYKFGNLDYGQVASEMFRNFTLLTNGTAVTVPTSPNSGSQIQGGHIFIPILLFLSSFVAWAV